MNHRKRKKGTKGGEPFFFFKKGGETCFSSLDIQTINEDLVCPKNGSLGEKNRVSWRRVNVGAGCEYAQDARASELARRQVWGRRRGRGGGEGSHRQAAGVPAGARRSAGCSIGAKRLSWPSQSVARCSVDLF